MDEALKRRLLGALILIVVVFVVSLLLPRPGAVSTDTSSQRVTLDLTGNSPEPAPMPVTPTPVPPVIAAPAEQTASNTDSTNRTDSNDNSTPPQIEEPPLPATTPAPSATSEHASAAEPPKPASKVEAKAITSVIAPKVSTPAPSTSTAKAEIAKIDDKPALKLEDTLNHKPAPAVEKPVEKATPKVVAKVPSPVVPKVIPNAAPATPVVAAKTGPATPGKHWFVQIGAFSEIGNAHQALDKLAAKGLKGIISPLDSDRGTRYRARLGPFTGRDQAKQAQDQAAKLGYAGSAVVQD